VAPHPNPKNPHTTGRQWCAGAFLRPPSTPPPLCAADRGLKLTSCVHLPTGPSQEVPDVNAANAFVASSYDRYATCLASFGSLAATTSAIGEQASTYSSSISALAASWPSQIFSAGALAIGVALLLYGFKLVRPVNFVAGTYLGGTASLILLQIFAATLTQCAAIVGIASACGLGLGYFCSTKRSSVLIVLGLVVGEIVGDNFYKLFLAGVLPEYVAFGCIGFFAVLVRNAPLARAS
jgi:hypothetical protein